ncbi:MAG: hypothetical protein ACRDZ4_00255 [Egibacteraceae bacterium]
MMTDEELLSRVRQLREAGRSPKAIARALGVRPAVVAPLVRTVARQAATAAPEPALVGCWLSQGWSEGLSVDGHEEWPDVSRSDGGASGLACVAVVRRRRAQRVSVCGYLVDVYCLGVKDALGPRVMDERDLPVFLNKFFGGFEEVGAPLAAPLDLVRHLVWGAGGPSTTPGGSASSPLPISGGQPVTSGRGRRPAPSRSDETAYRCTYRVPTTTRPWCFAPCPSPSATTASTSSRRPRPASAEVEHSGAQSISPARSCAARAAVSGTKLLMIRSSFGCPRSSPGSP